jgi:hypothetical protein
VPEHPSQPLERPARRVDIHRAEVASVADDGSVTLVDGTVVRGDRVLICAGVQTPTLFGPLRVESPRTPASPTRASTPPARRACRRRRATGCRWALGVRAGGAGPLAEARGETGGQVDTDRKLLAAVENLHESNPMLGLRGVRLGLLTPGLFALQVRAVAEAASNQIAAGKDPRVEIMVPLVGSVMELHLVRDEAERILADVAAETGVTLAIPIGTMIELPRAALTAHRIADAADFFSFGTNDLTQTTWGFSRDDAESTVFAAYLDKGVFTVSPFETVDGDGVGRLVQIAAQEGRKTKPGLKLGVCGEHGGDPESIHFFHQTGLDYVSCSGYPSPASKPAGPPSTNRIVKAFLLLVWGRVSLGGFQ